MRNPRLEEAQAGIKIARRNINRVRYADDTTLMEEREEELKNLLMKVKEEIEKAGLKLNIQTVRNYFGVGRGAPKSLKMVTAAMKLEDACSLAGKL